MALSRRSSSFLIYTLLALVVLAVVVFLMLRHLENTNGKAARSLGRPLPVQTVRIDAGSVDEELGTEGTTKETEIVPLSALTKGLVTEIDARLGDVVRKGQRLVEMEPDPLLIDLKSQKDQLLADEDQLKVNAKLADVMQNLYNKGVIVLADLDAALLNKFKSENQVAKDRDAVAISAENLKLSQIDSPVDGLVTARDVYVGAVLNAITPIMTVAQIDPILVQAPFNENKAKFIYLGQPARVFFYSSPGQVVEGHVQWINPEIDSNRLIWAQVIIPNHDLKILPGMHGIVYLDNKQPKVLRIPSVAVISSQENRGYVFVVDNGNKAHIREVSLGAYAEGYIEVKSGLQAGEQIVVVGQANLQDNDSVSIAGSSGLANPQ